MSSRPSTFALRASAGQAQNLVAAGRGRGGMVAPWRRGRQHHASSRTTPFRLTTTGRSTRAARRRSKAATPTISPRTRSFPRATRSDIRAVNVNSIDEVPDSSWFTNRIGRGAMTTAEIVRGPNQLETVSIDDWPIVQEKSSGITPGYRVVDPADKIPSAALPGEVRPAVDTRRWPSAAEVIGAAIYHALGYNVVQGYIVEVDPARIVISPKATTVDLSGRQAPDDTRATSIVCSPAARVCPNGKYRGDAEPVRRRPAASATSSTTARAGRPERHPPARAPARAARESRVLRLAEP